MSGITDCARKYNFRDTDISDMLCLLAAARNKRMGDDIIDRFLSNWLKNHSKEEMMMLVKNILLMAESVVQNNQVVIDSYCAESGSNNMDGGRLNLPTLTGALYGIRLASNIDVDKVCAGCTFRLGSPANQSPQTACDAEDAVTDDETVFQCHEELDRDGNAYRACGGFAQKAKDEMRLQGALDREMMSKQPPAKAGGFASETKDYADESTP